MAQWDAYFVDVTFSEATTFSGKQFNKEADFSGTTFEKGANFSLVTFIGRVNFRGATFREEADFRIAYFNKYPMFWGAIFHGEANFRDNSFMRGASFWGALFHEEANFRGATFRGGLAHFREAEFGGVTDFSGVRFDTVHFWGAYFKGKACFLGAAFEEEAQFFQTTFKEGAAFEIVETSSQTVFDFRGATTEKPEQMTFHTIHLRPSAFINTDPLKFDFSDVEWFRLANGDKLTLEAEVEVLSSRFLEPIYPPESLRQLARACRKLMNNAEEYRDYPTANEPHYWSMEAVRKEGWSRLGLIATSYWLLSGYGERPRRAFVGLAVMWAVFAILYMAWGASELRPVTHSRLEIYQFHNPSLTIPFLQPNFVGLHKCGGTKGLPVTTASEIRQSLPTVGRSLGYSLAALVRLRPEPHPEGPGWFQIFVTVEGILGPLQIALLALAVRRKVMR